MSNESVNDNYQKRFGNDRKVCKIDSARFQFRESRERPYVRPSRDHELAQLSVFIIGEVFFLLGSQQPVFPFYCSFFGRQKVNLLLFGGLLLQFCAMQKASRTAHESIYHTTPLCNVSDFLTSTSCTDTLNHQLLSHGRIIKFPASSVPTQLTFPSPLLLENADCVLVIDDINDDSQEISMGKNNRKERGRIPAGLSEHFSICGNEGALYRINSKRIIEQGLRWTVFIDITLV